MFALAVAPMLFLCAFLMAHEKTMLIGYLSALLFASTGLFQNHMTYDPVGLINTSIAAVIATATALVLWAVVAPADAGSGAPPVCPRRAPRARPDRGAAVAHRPRRVRDGDGRGSRPASGLSPRRSARGRRDFRGRHGPSRRRPRIDPDAREPPLPGRGRSGSDRQAGRLPASPVARARATDVRKKRPRNALPNCARTNSGRSRRRPPPAIWAPSPRSVRISRAAARCSQG